MNELNYGRMMQRAMQGLVADVLGQVAADGLPGDHHFYITFKTGHPSVDMPDWLFERFPEEMTIVLQHEFWDLAVMGDRFSVSLSFSRRPATLVVPFDAITQFADPSAEFGLVFDPTEVEPSDDDGDAAEDDATEPTRLRTDGQKPEDARQHSDAAQGGDEAAAREGEEETPKSGEVVRLDAFRKK